MVTRLLREVFTSQEAISIPKLHHTAAHIGRKLRFEALFVLSVSISIDHENFCCVGVLTGLHRCPNALLRRRSWLAHHGIKTGSRRRIATRLHNTGSDKRVDKGGSGMAGVLLPVIV